VAHGGAAPQVRAAAARRLAEEAATRAVVSYGLPRDIDPHEALLEEVHRTAGHVAWLAEQVRGIEPDALTWGRTSAVDKGAGEFPGIDTTHAAVPPVLLELYLRERRHLVEVCKAAIAAGVEERRVRLAERQGIELAGVFRRVMGRLALTAEQLALAPRLFSEEISALMDSQKVIEGSVR
jgi:hypothetical protein